MSLITHARRELTNAGLFDADSDYDGKLGEAVMELVTAFANQGHSGHSASLVLDLFNKVAGYQILSPLEDKEDEWLDVSEQSGYPFFQNRRLSSVFKDGDGVVTCVDATVYVNPDGTRFTRGKTVIQLPWVPTQTNVYLGWDGEVVTESEWKTLSHEHDILAATGVENIEDLDIKSVAGETLIVIPSDEAIALTPDSYDPQMVSGYVEYAKLHEKILYVTQTAVQMLLTLPDFEPVQLHSLLHSRGFLGTCRGVPVVTNAFYRPISAESAIELPGAFCTSAVTLPVEADTETKED